MAARRTDPCFAQTRLSDNPQFLPYGRQSIDESDVDAVCQVLRSEWLTMGPMVEAFEEALAEHVGSAGAVACASGTAALHLATLALKIGPGHAVVVPAITFVATANAPRLAGAEIIFADVDPKTGLMMPEHVEAALAAAQGPHAKAVFPVHLNGQCGDPMGIRSLARQHGLRVIEDACHAVGGSYRSTDGMSRLGACDHSDLTTFSFHPVKTISTGEGGIVTGNDPEMLSSLRLLRNHGMVRDGDKFENRDAAFDSNGESNPWYYEISELGLNYRLSDIHCALGLSQLTRLDAFVARRRTLVERYRHALADLSPIASLTTQIPWGEPAWHLMVVLIDFEAVGMSRAEVMKALRLKGIGSQVHYIPLYRQPYYHRRYGEMRLPGAEAYYDRCLSLPLFFEMSENDVDRVVMALKEVFECG